MHREIQKPLSLPRPAGLSLRAIVQAYVSLTKPRIISLLLVVTIAVMIIAGGKVPAPGLMLWTMLGGALMSGAANTFNCYVDRDIDRIMSRTRNRPLVTNVISPLQALVFGMVLALLALVLFVVTVNLLSGLLALAGLLVYVFIYTPSKRVTRHSVLIGAIAGAAPPLVAWAAVTGSINGTALMLFAIMAIWQVPHTLALTLMLYSDYARANVPVSPVVQGPERTQRDMAAYSVLLWVLSLLPVATGFFGLIYGLGALVLGAQFVSLATNSSSIVSVAGGKGRSDIRLYKYSLLYLALLFALMTADRLLLH